MLKRIGLLVVLLTTACSAPASMPLSTPPASPASPGTAGSAETSVVATLSTPTSPTTAASQSAATSIAAPAPDPEPYLPGLGVAEIAQLTPTSGGGRRPLLSWEPLPDATSYTVLVMDAEGAPWWAWSGPGTEVIVGGVDTQVEIGGGGR